MNRKYQHLDYAELIDQLARETARYTNLLNENGTSDQREDCRETIHRILAEIKIRERESESSDPANRLIR